MRLILAAVLLIFAGSVFADQYQVTFGWTDPTTYSQPGDAPTYEAEWRVNGGAATLITGLSTPGGSFTLTANPGDVIEMQARAVNQGLVSAWLGWFAATAPAGPSQPVPQTNFSITIQRTGP